jgi:hypothetical protein
MLSWLYDIFVTIVSFIMGLFGFDLKKRSVHFEDEVEETKNEIKVTHVPAKEEEEEKPAEADVSE